MSNYGHHFFASAAATLLVASAATAQLLPALPLPSVGGPVGQLPVAGPVLQQLLGSPDARQVISPTLDSVAGVPERVAGAGQATLLDLRRLRLQQLIKEHRGELEAAEGGVPVRRGLLVALDPDPVSLALAARAGFRVVGETSDAELGMRIVQLAVPRNLSAREALRRLSRAAPALQADYDHIYEPAGGALLPFAGSAVAQGVGGGARPRIGMVDGGVAAHPSLASASIDQHGFAGAPRATGHGTAVASLIVGSHGAFQGAARDASLLVADVYGGSRSAGSATAIVKALGWLASKRPQVVNISLVGPSNRLVQRAIAAVHARGISVVAAVGNDGPAAPPQYPASYPGVIAITGVDASGKALLEAGKATHLDFAAPGADMAAAMPGQGYARVRGTSFAAPLAAARLALAGSPQRLAAEARPGKGRVGRGIVCSSCRVAPKAVGAK
ncbi:MAG TPA: S8 family serine peptidase [Sphingomicrobium sp.]|nr:S8 family serine peptidase [Sphingomicrobium sp.]